MIPSFVFALLGNFLRLKLLNMYICFIPKVKVETYFAGHAGRGNRGSRVCNMGLFPLEKLKSITNYIDKNS